MPFTPAHPAIVLPLLRSRYFSATGLIAGCMAPDFEYFFKMSVSSVYSHTVAGLFYFDLPVTILISLIFHLVVKRNLIHNLPGFLQKKFQPLSEIDFVKYLKEHPWIFIISVLLGGSSHLLWDSFTHHNTFFTRSLSIYKELYVPYEGVRYPLFYALQTISTFAGLAIVLMYILLMRSSPIQTHSKQKFLYWLTVATITLVITWVRFVVRPLGTDIGNLIVSIISAFMLALVCCGFINFKQTNIAQESLNG